MTNIKPNLKKLTPTREYFSHENFLFNTRGGKNISGILPHDESRSDLRRNYTAELTPAAASRSVKLVSEITITVEEIGLY